MTTITATTTTTTPRAQILTSLVEIKSFNPCAGGWKDILTGQKKTTTDAVQFPIVDCLDSNSVSDVFWLFRRLGNPEQVQIFAVAARLFAASIATYKNKYAAAAAAAADYAAAAAAADAAAAAAARAAADAADYADYADAANAADYAAAAADYVAAAADYADYAAADYAAAAAAAADYAAAAVGAAAVGAVGAAVGAAAAVGAQKEKNKQILRKCILDWESGLI